MGKLIYTAALFVIAGVLAGAATFGMLTGSDPVGISAAVGIAVLATGLGLTAEK